MQTPTNLSLIPHQLSSLGLGRFSERLVQLVARYERMYLHMADKHDEPEVSISGLLAFWIDLSETSVSAEIFVAHVLALSFNHWHVWLDDKKWSPLLESLEEFDPKNEAISMELEQPLISVLELQNWLEGKTA